MTFHYNNDINLNSIDYFKEDRMKKIIAITGSAGAGKDSFADIVINNSKEKWIKLSFASHLKDVAALLFGFDRAMLEGDTVEHRTLREQPDEFWSEKMGKDFTPRQALQILGTDLLRNQLHKNIWVDCLEKKLANIDCNVLITDCRFKNEINMLKNLNATFVRMEFKDKPEYWAVALNANKYWGHHRQDLEIFVPYVEMDKKYWEEHKSECTNENNIENYKMQHISEVDWIGYDRPDYIFLHQNSLEELKEEILNSEFWKKF